MVVYREEGDIGISMEEYSVCGRGVPVCSVCVGGVYGCVARVYYERMAV